MPEPRTGKPAAATPAAPVSLDRAWFGAFDLPHGTRARWRVGALSLTVERAFGEWRVWERQDALLGSAVFEPEAPAPDAGEARRFVTSDRGERLRVEPLLPDRTVVARPISPLVVPAGETARLYVSIPLWLRLEVGEARKPLAEFASQRLSDTWMGADTLEGELGYALKSRCRTQLAPEQFAACVAIAPLVIRNRYVEGLGLERVAVPVRQLGLFRESTGQFWTHELTLERGESGEMAAVRVGAGAPAEAAGAEQVGQPREAAHRHAAIRAFSALFQG